MQLEKTVGIQWKEQLKNRDKTNSNSAPLALPPPPLSLTVTGNGNGEERRGSTRRDRCKRKTNRCVEVTCSYVLFNKISNRYKNENSKEPVAAEGQQRFVLRVESSHSALNLLTISHFHLRRKHRQVTPQTWSRTSAQNFNFSKSGHSTV